MNGLFEEYGWLLVSMIGGFTGFVIFIAAYFVDGSLFCNLIDMFVGGLI